MANTIKILGIIMGLFLLTLAGICIYAGLTQKTGSTIGECYDKYSNEIIGEECIMETTIFDNITLIFVGLAIIFCAFVFVKICWEANI